MLVVFIVTPTIEGSGEIQTPEVKEFNPLTLTCHASGIPRPAISWFKNRQRIAGNTSHYHISNGGSQLLIVSAQVGDATRFTCKAENVAGGQEKAFDVDVLGKDVTLIN